MPVGRSADERVSHVNHAGRWLRAVTWCVVVLCAFALRLPGLRQSLWVDEVFRTFVGLSGSMMKGPAAWLLWRDVHNPLYNAVMWVWIRVFGDAEVTIRVPSLIAAGALVAVVYGWVRERFGIVAARLAGLWLLFSPVHVWYSTEAKNNIFTVLFTTLAVVWLERALRRRTLGSIACSAGCALLAVMTDFQSLLVLGPVWVFAAWIVGRGIAPGRETWSIGPEAGWRAWVPLVASVLAALCFLVPWVVYKSGHASELARAYLGYMHWFEPVRLLLVYFPTGYAFVGAKSAMWVMLAVVMGMLIGPALCRGVGALRGKLAGGVVLIGVCAPMLLMFIASEAMVMRGDGSRVYQPRNVLVMLPWVAVLLGVGMSALWARCVWWTKSLAVMPLVIGLVATVWMREVAGDRTTVMSPNPDWRGAAAWVRSRSDRGVLPVVTNTMTEPLQYYLPGGERVYVRDDRELNREAVEALARARGWSEVVVIDNPNWRRGWPAHEMELLREWEVANAEFRSLMCRHIRVPIGTAERAPTP